MYSIKPVIPIGGQATRLAASGSPHKIKALIPLANNQTISERVLMQIEDIELHHQDIEPPVFIRKKPFSPQEYRDSKIYSYLLYETRISGYLSTPGTLQAFMTACWEKQDLYICGDHVFQDNMILTFIQKSLEVYKNFVLARKTYKETVPTFVGVITPQIIHQAALYYCDQNNVVQYMTQAAHLETDKPAPNLIPYEDVGLMLYMDHRGEFYGKMFEILIAPLKRSFGVGQPGEISNTLEETEIPLTLADFIELLHPIAINLDPYQYVNVNTQADIDRANAMILSTSQRQEK